MPVLPSIKLRSMVKTESASESIAPLPPKELVRLPLITVRLTLTFELTESIPPPPTPKLSAIALFEIVTCESRTSRPPPLEAELLSAIELLTISTSDSKKLLALSPLPTKLKPPLVNSSSPDISPIKYLLRNLARSRWLTFG